MTEPAGTPGPAAPLPPVERERVAALAERVRAPLADRAIALAALTHKSWVNEHREARAEDNERLEFLGDAVVDLLVSDWLMARFPAAREGELSKLRAAVVDESGLSSIGRALRLGELLRLGRGEELTGGREKASLLADATEAVIAAVFLDGGLPAAHRLIDPFLEEAYARAASGSLDRDWKTQLQEQVQARLRVSPRYRIVGEIGPDHAKTFEVVVEARGMALGRGSGRSKKDAEQAAARAGLDALPDLPAGPEVVAPAAQAVPAAPEAATAVPEVEQAAPEVATAAPEEAPAAPERAAEPEPPPAPEEPVAPQPAKAPRKRRAVARPTRKGAAKPARPAKGKAARGRTAPAATRRTRKIAVPRVRD